MVNRGRIKELAKKEGVSMITLLHNLIDVNTTNVNTVSQDVPPDECDCKDGSCATAVSAPRKIYTKSAGWVEVQR